LTIRIKAKVIALLAVYGTAFVCAVLVYFSWRDSNVTKIEVSTIADFATQFEVGESSLRVKDPEILRVCFVGDYVHALKDARYWFGADETEFKTALRAAGGRADAFNDGGKFSIVLLSHSSAVILQFDWRAFYLANLGCAGAHEGDIALRKTKFTSSAGLYLPDATLKAPLSAGQPRATACAEKLQRFVESIDDLLAENIGSNAYFVAVFSRYMPAQVCTVEEVMAISRTSRFFVPREQGVPPDRVIEFSNSDTNVSFVLHQDTGNIGSPEVWLTTPSL
jgi:hypothetical protein